MDKVEYPIGYSLKQWSKNCPGFDKFIQEYRRKILYHKVFEGKKKNRRPKSIHSLKSVECELWLAYLFLSADKRFTIEYEKYGGKSDGKKAEKDEGPDFTLTFQQSPLEQPFEFNVEVTRFCQTDIETRYQQVKNEIISTIKEMSSGLRFGLSTLSCNEEYMVELDNSSFDIDKFETQKDDIIQFIKETIQREKDRLSYDSSHEYLIPNFEKELFLTLNKPFKPSPQMRAGRTPDLGGVDPIFYTQREFEKFVRKIIRDKLSQMRDKECNLLVIVSNTPTIDESDLQSALEFIRNKILQKDDSFFVDDMKFEKDLSAFVEHYKNLSGILFIGTGEGEFILKNNPQAYKPVPQNLQGVLEKVNHIILQDNMIARERWFSRVFSRGYI